jgi:hypothetical protein
MDSTDVKDHNPKSLRPEAHRQTNPRRHNPASARVQSPYGPNDCTAHGTTHGEQALSPQIPVPATQQTYQLVGKKPANGKNATNYKTIEHHNLRKQWP